ncbi:glycosyl transferase [Spiribacter halobius]|uniref:Glycosyl transferase n=2 Tax=Sediminicurvatus halobius TaxID=2182432 RepID=A0A2U2N7A5_9GAMM|nr:glycosyl transferase [Spiribacter halobius]
MAFSGAGGVERMVLNLLAGLQAEGPSELAIDLIPIRAGNLPRERVPEGVRVVDLGLRHSTLAARALAGYLRRERPDAVLTAKDRAIRATVSARRLAGVETRIVGRLGTNLSAALAGQGALRRWLRQAPMRRLYRDVDAIVAVSEGVAEDTRAITGLPAGRVLVVRNPVVTPELAMQAQAPVDHPWLQPGAEVPVILGAGRLTRQKDFPTLIRAFATLRRHRPARLVILGEGGERGALERSIAELGLGDDVALPGHQKNPWAWMARASLFVLSSAWEGSPNVLTEAIACGTPVVATDCPSGPRELLEDGRYGHLVPVGDAAALAEAMHRTLEAPLPAETLREAAAEYTVAASARGYLQTLRLAQAEAERSPLGD